ncbi:MAG: phosphoribosylanthranilate isomerase [Candidatus Omnitrophota bacterium]|nr:MAG: phosphoribosylanthranilate isomerase [Candidatus Omnitrophota bacterium]
MVKVKICGITNLADAVKAVILGAGALGFVFYKKSPRYIAPKKAKEIIKLMPKRILKVGVFVNAKEKSIKDIARTCKLDLLQFHADETPEFCSKFKGYRIIKAFRVKGKIDLKRIAEYKTYAYLFDTFSKTKFGGTGKAFNRKALKDIHKLKQKVFLSGGLNARNVKQAVKTVRPDWVDVSSAVETSPGRKDYKKIRDFIKGTFLI